MAMEAHGDAEERDPFLGAVLPGRFRIDAAIYRLEGEMPEWWCGAEAELVGSPVPQGRALTM